MMTVSRQEIRKQIRDARQKLSASAQQQSALLLTNQLSIYDKVLNAEHIAIYLSNDGELNTSEFIDWCWQKNKCVYLPVLHPFSRGNLLFLRYQKNTPMVENQYGIKEPKLDVTKVRTVNQLDIVFTPLVAFDDNGNRLGMGGGFYDRTLAQLPKKNSNSPAVIGLAHNCQQVPLIPIESWDIPIPTIITPTKIHQFK